MRKTSYSNYVTVNAHAVLKQVVSAHSYNELKSQTEVVNAALKASLEAKMTRAGVEITSMTLSELNYAPEIASAMLKKQRSPAAADVSIGVCQQPLSEVD